jgi:DNA-binding FadR family transcriptional regulator
VLIQVLRFLGFSLIMHTPAFKRHNLSDQVFSSLRSQIMNGGLTPGAKMPSHAELSKKMQVSSTVIRDAIGKLCSIGLVEVRHGSGTFVRGANLQTAIMPITNPLDTNDAYLLDLLEFRFTVELYMISGATRMCTKKDFSALDKNCKLLEKHLKDMNYIGAVEADWEFHMILASIKNNIVIQDCLNAVKEALAPILLHMFQTNEKQFLSSIVDHRRILDAMKTGSPTEAEKAMSTHLLRYYKR